MKSTLPPRALRALQLLALTISIGCASNPVPRSATLTLAQDLDLRSQIDRLYTAFCFDAGEEADWDTLRSMFAEGATFASPAPEGKSHAGVDGETFIGEFRRFILGSPLGETGYHERVTKVVAGRFGRIAHTWVTFDGFVPGQEADRRGVDSIQWVNDDGWKLMSFTTQYEREGLSLPTRFAP